LLQMGYSTAEIHSLFVNDVIYKFDGPKGTQETEAAVGGNS
jgi:hypothetical protein